MNFSALMLGSVGPSEAFPLAASTKRTLFFAANATREPVEVRLLPMREGQEGENMRNSGVRERKS
jgi:hypothetical protein